MLPIRSAALVMMLSGALCCAPAVAKTVKPPPQADSDQSYLYIGPDESRHNLPGYIQESIDPGNNPDTGTMFGEDDQDESPGSFGLDDN